MRRFAMGGMQVTWAIAAVLAALLAALLLAGIGPHWEISPDSATYVGAAQRWAAGRFDTGAGGPPLTSAAFALVLRAAPRGYTALNAWNHLLLLSGILLAWRLLARDDPRAAGISAVLSLCSVALINASTQLLSEPLYLLLSVAALRCVTIPRQSGGARQAVAGAALLVALALTRTIGLALVLAVAWTSWPRDGVRLDTRTRLLLLGSAAACCAAVAWDSLAGAGYIGGWLRMFAVDDPFASAPRSLGVGALASRAWHGAAMLGTPGRAVLNVTPPGSAWARDTVLLLASLLVLACARRALRGKLRVAGVYVAVYVTVVLAHMIFMGDDDLRYLLPVMPFLVYSVVVTALRGRHHVALAAWALLFVGVGTQRLVRVIRAAHLPAEDGFEIRRSSNTDLEQVARWLREHSAPDARFAARQRSMLVVLTRREGSDLASAPRSANLVAAWLEARGVQYVVLHDEAKGSATATLVTRMPRRFPPVMILPRAGLYRVLAPALPTGG
ncbi:MAG: hypothetical protein JWO05_1335 [Gemmatimonadetes bacterium]|nr:hypothetical protein [Gemmatimonadota bacterium]